MMCATAKLTSYDCCIRSDGLALGNYMNHVKVAVFKVLTLERLRLVVEPGDLLLEEHMTITY